MRKRLARALPILLALAPWPALADVTATYKAGIDRLIVEVADNGDARVQIDDLVYLRHDGEEYLTLGKFAGMVLSGRRDDMVQFFRVLFQTPPTAPDVPASAAVKPRLEPVREIEVLGLKGQVFRITPQNAGDPAESIEAAFTTSPSLTPVHHVLQSAIVGVFDVFGPQDTRRWLRAVVAAMAEKGAPLMVRNAETVQLLAVDFSPIAAKRFAVPEDLATPEMLRSLGREMQEKRKRL